jgi:hypothetical protein
MSVGMYLSLPTLSLMMPNSRLSTSGGSSESLRLARHHLHDSKYKKGARIYLFKI